MAERPPAVAIDDLANPRFPPEMEPIRAAMADMGAQLSLDPDVLMAAAVAETGLDDFGERDFVPRLEFICECLTKEAGLGPGGMVATFTQLQALLRNRLRVEDLVRRHPEILDLDVARPIIICGLPRTGTTHLHNLLSADPTLRSLPYWESEEPVNRPEPVDGRNERTAMGLDVLNTAMPYFKRMHEMTPEHVHEEIGLIALDFSGMQFETMAPMPSWRDWYRAADQRPHYAYLKKVLQVLQFLRGGDRWVLKSPQHLEQFPALLATFPDATFVVTHRDPVSVTASLGTMLSYLARLSLDPVDPHRVAGYWAHRLETMLRACVDTRTMLPSDRAIDVGFQEFMADDVAMVRRVYEVAGQPFTPAVRKAMDDFMAEHERGRHGGVNYRFEDLGLDPAERRRALQFYVDRFEVEVES
jgi:sulfotransferase family protein